MSGCVPMLALGFLGFLLAGPLGLIVGVIAGGFAGVIGQRPPPSGPQRPDWDTR